MFWGIFNEKKFEIIRKIGEGGFGEVYLIEKDKKFYALKKIKQALSEEENNKYNKLISTLKNINNRFVAKYYYTFIENNSFNIVMEYCGEKNLKQFIDDYRNKNQLIEENIICFIITQICLGLKDIHKNYLIHRDLTPDNIFIDENNLIKIGDFGISKITTTNKYAKSRIGKYQYFAPEMEMEKKYNNKIDIYSFGCIIYELFIQNEYFIDKNIKEKVSQINSDIYNPEWQSLINKLLDKDYHKRPDIEEVYHLIQLIHKNISFNFKPNYFNIYFLIENKYYNEIKDNIKCQYCFKLALEPFECLNCKKLYCKSCIEKTEIHKCENAKYFLNLEKMVFFLNLEFFCKQCFATINYQNIDKHIINGCLKKGKFLKEINENEFWDLRNNKNITKFSLNCKLYFIS